MEGGAYVTERGRWVGCYGEWKAICKGEWMGGEEIRRRRGGYLGCARKGNGRENAKNE